jgi:type VI secretion system protein VasJ
MNVAELIELGTKPIRPDAPGGDPARDGTEFEALQNEIRKLEAPDQPTVNWELVVRAATSISTSQSKDLLVAAYLALALYEIEGFAGLAVGLHILGDYVDQFWETCFPEIKRLRGRAAAFEWLSERGARAIERARKKPTVESINECVERVTAIDDKTGSLLDMPPLLGDLRRALEEAQSSLPQPSSAPSASSAPAEGGGGAAQTYYEPAPSGPVGIQSVEDAESLDKAIEELMRVGDLCATWTRANDPTDPIGYRLSRMLSWRYLRETPPNEDGVTLLPDFDLAVIEQLEQLHGSGEHAAVLEQTEALFPTSPLWFDLTRYAVQALEAQGKEFSPAVDAVVNELATTLKRVPDVIKLKTSGGIPFADDATKKWIAKKVMAASGGIDIGPTADSGGGARVRGGEAFPEAQREARKHARGGKLSQALRLLAEGAARTERLEDRITWKLESARVSMQAGRFEMALAQLEALDDELKRASIEDWDPALCAEILRDLLRCRQQVAQSGDFPPAELARSRELMGRLCRLDVVSALELNGRE